MARRRRNPTDDRLRRAETGRGGDPLREAIRAGRVIAPREPGRYPVIETSVATTYREHFALRERKVPLFSGFGGGVREFTQLLGVTVELHVPPFGTGRPMAQVRAWWSGSPGSEASWVIPKARIPDPWWTEPSIQAWLRHAAEGTQPPGRTVPVPAPWPKQNPRGDEALRGAQRGGGGDPKVEAWRRGIPVPPDGDASAPSWYWEDGEGEWEATWDRPVPQGGRGWGWTVVVRLRPLPTFLDRAQAEGYVQGPGGGHHHTTKVQVHQHVRESEPPDWTDPRIQQLVHELYVAALPEPRSNPGGDERERRARRDAAAGGNVDARLRAEAEVLRREGPAWRDDVYTHVPWAVAMRWDDSQEPLLVFDNDRTIYEYRKLIERWLVNRLILRDYSHEEAMQLWRYWAAHSRDLRSLVGRQGTHEAVTEGGWQAAGRFLDQASRSWTPEEVAHVMSEPLVKPDQIFATTRQNPPICRTPGRRRCPHRTLVYVPRPDLGPGHQEERCHACGALLDLVTPATAHPRPPGPQQLKQLPGAMG